MKLVIAIHGILTRQTDASWPDKFDAWMSRRDPAIKVLKKEYAAGPFPRWNCWVRDPRLAHGLVNEIELFGEQPIWFVAHSNGAVIALLAAKQLLERGHRVAGLILTGAACEADLAKNGVREWLEQGSLGVALAYCSADDEVVAGDARADKSFGAKVRDWFWGKAMWPYGCLGRTGWLWKGQPLSAPGKGEVNLPLERIMTRWFPGGHSTYFAPANIEKTFEQIYQDINQS
jgi:pimeloyl-ACP methyl ester carboxylesterase